MNNIEFKVAIIIFALIMVAWVIYLVMSFIVR